MKVVTLALLLCLVASPLASQDVPTVPARKVQATLPPPDLVGPDATVPRAVGQACFFRVMNLPKETISDLFIVPSSGDFLSLFDSDGNPVGVFAADRAGSFTCVLVCVIEGKIFRDTHTVVIGGPVPIPPGPTPPGPVPPGPTPVPDGKLGFTKMAFTEASTIAAGSRSKAVELADNFDGAASAIAAGALRSVEASNAEVTAGNRRILADPVHKGAWTPFFFVWAKQSDAALTAGTLKPTVEEYAEIYRATAQGLRLVK